LIQLIILQPLLFYLFHKLLSLFPTYYTLQFSFSQSAFRRTGTRSRLWLLFTGRHFLNWKCRMIQWWQQILPIWNAKCASRPEDFFIH